MNIPNFVDIPFVKEDRTLTDEWKFILQQLFKELQMDASDEGLVIPSQTTSNITVIQNNTSFNRDTPNNDFTTQFGTMIYDSDLNMAKIAVYDEVNPTIPSPIFLPVVLIIDRSGNPNGSQAGTLNQLCLDTVAKILYICTQTGTAATAIWTAV